MRLLVVEDDPHVARFVVSALSEARYAVDHSRSGREALDRALRGAYDAIIMDVVLPGDDGVGVVRTLRASGCRTPVLYLSAKDETQDIVRGLDAGGDDYMTKPFSIAELLARVRARVRTTGLAANGSDLSLGDLEVRPLERRAFRGGRLLALTAREFDLLEYFMRNAGHVLTRSMILSRVWNVASDYDSNLVEVHLARLRKKLESASEPRVIETVKGVGYVLRAPGARTPAS